MARVWKNPHGYVIDLPEFRITQREQPGAWFTKGSCHDLPGTPKDRTDLFFDEDRTDEAKMICSACPVRLSCLHHAIRAGEKYGVWGGTDEIVRGRTFTRAWRKDGRLPVLCQRCSKPYIKTTSGLDRFCSRACHKEATR